MDSSHKVSGRESDTQSFSPVVPKKKFISQIAILGLAVDGSKLQKIKLQMDEKS